MEFLIEIKNPIVSGDTLLFYVFYRSNLKLDISGSEGKSNQLNVYVVILSLEHFNIFIA